MVIEWLILLPVVMLLNRIRGGGMSNFTDSLPGRTLYYVSALIGGFVYLLTSSWIPSVIIGLGFAIAMAPGWGLWFEFEDRSDDPRNKDLVNRLINYLSRGSPFFAMFWRMYLFVWPMFFGLVVFGFISGVSAGLFLFGFSLLFASCYGIRKYFDLHNRYAEFMVGGLWWLQILLIVI